MISKCKVSACAFLFATFASSAFAQQTLSPAGQAIANSVTPAQLQAACAKGSDGIKALVSSKIADVPAADKRAVAPQGPAIGQSLMAKCPK
jgi:hypothetical protein